MIRVLKVFFAVLPPPLHPPGYDTYIDGLMDSFLTASLDDLSSSGARVSVVHVNPFTVHVNPFTVHVNPFTVHVKPFTVHVNPFTVHVLLRAQVSCFWPMEGEWYEGSLESYDPKTHVFRVRYDDGEHEDLTLPDETVKLLA